MEQSNKKKKTLFMVLGLLMLVSTLVGVSIAFFNYTRTGSPNSIAVGNIYFNSNYTAVTLENVFPIDKANVLTDTDNVMTINVSIQGNTSYPGGIDYKVTASNVRITTNGKNIPLSVNVTSSDLPNNSVTLYSYEDGTILQNDSEFAVGHIPPNTNVNGTITLRVYIDGNQVAVSDTYDGTESDNMGTTSDWVRGRTVLTTTEWNALQTSGIGFSVKVSADEGVYDSNAVGYLTYNKNQLLGSTPLRQALKGDGTDTITASLDVPNFRGWSTTPDGEVEYKLGDTINFNSDTTLYAVIKKQSGSEKVLEAINEHATGTCQNIKYVEDEITYFSGTKDCINFNYVWYSGKLWRITAIYPDGTMKLITENNITLIAFNESGQVNFYTDENTTSYMYQWLNEDFYDTLYQPSNFIDTTKRWNATMPANTTISTKPLENNMVTANVGLLNSYEYYNSYRCIGSTACTGSTRGTGYLNIGYFWWLLNPYNTSKVWSVYYGGNGDYDNPASAFGVRPTIYLKSGLEFTGVGTRDNPYKIVGDKDIGKTNDLINTRLSGEYVKLVNDENEQVFRIIGVEDNKTKIIAMDYADNKGTRKFATSTGTASTLWGSGTTIGTDTWYEYLNRVDNSDISNTGYYDKLVKTYGELFTSGTYYLGTSGYNNYKLSVCANTTSGNTKVCDETSQTGTFNIGLPRYGEMFATQQAGGSSNSISMWLMNRYSTSNVLLVHIRGYGDIGSPTNASGGRPTLHLKSMVKILSGSGTESDPYVVGL